MPFLDVMQTYFRGEKLEALWFILPLGIAFVVLGAVALRAEKGAFAWGVAGPVFVFGAIAIVTGLVVGLRTDTQVAALEQAYRDSPTAMVATELPRMQKVNANFRTTYVIFGVLVGIGLLVHYLGGPALGRGLGVALMLSGAVGLAIDSFAERRAEPYTQALQAITG